MGIVVVLLVFAIAIWGLTNFLWAVAITVCLIVAFFIWLYSSTSDDVEEATPEKKKSSKGPGFAVKARMKIRYTDADGESSEREIFAHRYTDSSPGYIAARCMKAKANRSFRTDRINDAVDMETGEVIKRIPTFMRSKRIE